MRFVPSRPERCCALGVGHDEYGVPFSWVELPEALGSRAGLEGWGREGNGVGLCAASAALSWGPVLTPTLAHLGAGGLIKVEMAFFSSAQDTEPTALPRDVTNSD